MINSLSDNKIYFLEIKNFDDDFKVISSMSQNYDVLDVAIDSFKQTLLDNPSIQLADFPNSPDHSVYWFSYAFGRNKGGFLTEIYLGVKYPKLNDRYYEVTFRSILSSEDYDYIRRVFPEIVLSEDA